MTPFEPNRHVRRPRLTPRLTRLLVLAGALAAALASSVRAQETPAPGIVPRAAPPMAAPASAEKTTALSPAHARWQSSLAHFAKADQAQFPASGGVVFVGSSTIGLWPRLAEDFRPWPVVLNRGFGGSTLADCSALVRELVIQYKPRQVVLYAGDNDLAEGRSPAEVLASFASFVRSVRAELPNSRIAYVSIKPSPARWLLMPQVREANALIAGHAQTLKEVRYIDAFSPMLTPEGLPRPELFRSDRLHLNRAGYQLWQALIAPHLGVPPSAGQADASGVAPAWPPQTAP